jgi:hypothetical protein
MCDANQGTGSRFFCSLDVIAELDYTAQPPTLVYRIVCGDTVRVAGDEATAAWAEFIALWSKPLCQPG